MESAFVPRMRKLLKTMAVLCLVGAPVVPAVAVPVLGFKRMELSRHFWSEGAAVGDFNRDGKPDVVSGPFWYEGPDFVTKHEIYAPAQTFKRTSETGTEEVIPGFEGGLGFKNTYSDNFFAFTRDLDGDGWMDVMVYGFPGKEAVWYQNPAGQAGHWKRHVVFDQVDNESPTFADVDGDGVPEIVCTRAGFLGYGKMDKADPTKPWVFHAVSPQGKWAKFTHGLGVGDVNGDGRMDLLEGGGWWEQPASLEGDPEWKKHPLPLGAGAQYYVGDVNGDGKPDILGSTAAHGYGLAWWEQVAGEGGEIRFRKHLIMGDKEADNRYGVKFSQLHALEFVDMNGDGLRDIVVGKRFWAHGRTGDPEPNAPAVVYWFELVRGKEGVRFVPHLIDDNSGVGTQVTVADANGDGLLDVVVGNKKGVFVNLQTRRDVPPTEAASAAPKETDGFVEQVTDVK
jgi:hypothetical protein